MSSRIIVIASLFIHPGREVEFRHFETAAAHVMKKYGGKMERVIRPTVSPSTNILPHEIHVITFPSMERFEAYRADADLVQLAPLRQSAIARTEVIIGAEGEPYV
jgi:uncharacterized protein (DUF1330 family)